MWGTMLLKQRAGAARGLVPFQVPGPPPNPGRSIYLREAVLLPRLHAWLCRYFAPHRRAETVATIAAAQGGTSEDATTVLAQQTIDECDRKLARYHAALEAG